MSLRKFLTVVAALAVAPAGVGQTPSLPARPGDAGKGGEPPSVMFDLMIVEKNNPGLDDKPRVRPGSSPSASRVDVTFDPPPGPPGPPSDGVRSMARRVPMPAPAPSSKDSPLAASPARREDGDHSSFGVWPEGSTIDWGALVDGAYVGARVIAAPRVTAPLGTAANLHLADQPKLVYLEPADRGLFRRIEMKPVELGVRLSLCAKDYDAARGTMTLDPVETTMTTIDGRDKVPGLELEVGRPRVVTRTLKLSLAAKVGEAYWVALPTPPNKEAVLALRPTVLPPPKK